jgi:hypothetical protein
MSPVTVQAVNALRIARVAFGLGLAICAFSLIPDSASGDSATAPPCSPAVQHGLLPTWAHSGFSQSAIARPPHALGRSGNIVAILFAYPLEEPAALDHNNKILWVSRVPYTWRASLRISAQRMNGTQALGRPVQRTIKGGPGPSLISLPTPGCWRFSLHWAGHSDSLDLQYLSRS